MFIILYLVKWKGKHCFYSFPRTALMIVAPTFLSMPLFVVGIPVAFVKARLAAVMPRALFKEKLNPGIFVLVITFIY